MSGTIEFEISCACLRAGLGVVRNSLATRLGPDRGFQVDETHFDSVWLGMPELGWEQPIDRRGSRAVFFESSLAAGWTIVVTNVDDGWVGLVSALSTMNSCLAYRFRSTPPGASMPIQLFNVIEAGREQRFVRAMKNDSGRWEFDQIGKPQVPEHVGRYAARSVGARFTRDAVLEIADGLGLRLSVNEFWTPKGAAIFARNANSPRVP